jgi:hypothetical protein
MGMRSEKTKLNELKNGRLAMLAFLGFCSQAAVRGLGPIDCLKLHLEDPWHNNSEWRVYSVWIHGVWEGHGSSVRLLGFVAVCLAAHAGASAMWLELRAGECKALLQPDLCMRPNVSSPAARCSFLAADPALPVVLLLLCCRAAQQSSPALLVPRAW